MLPGLTVAEAAAERPVLAATIVAVGLGGVVLVPSLALLFGLVLRGRFDREAATVEVETPPPAATRHGRPLGTLTLLALAIALPLTLLVDGGALQAVGVIALLAFLALASVTIGAAAAKAAASDD